MKTSILAAALILAAGAAHAVPQLTPVTQWNFNSVPADTSSSTGSLLPSIGTGSVSAVGLTSPLAFATGQTTSTSSSDPVSVDDTGLQTTGYAAQGTHNKARGVEFKVSTLGYQDVTVTWDTRHSNTAAKHQQFQYSTDGTTFLDFGTPFAATAGDTWFNNRSVNLSSILAVNNNPNFAFRLVAAFAPNTTSYAASTATTTYASTGTLRFDMVTVSAVPEASTYAMLLAGLGLLGFVARRRAR